MGRDRQRLFDCPVVHEMVKIQLRRRRSLGFANVEGYFVQCNQLECQYSSENLPPCPLDTSMYADEISALNEKKNPSSGWIDNG